MEQKTMLWPKNKKKHTRQVVLVEDDPDVAAAIRIALEMHKVETHVAPNGKLGLQLIDEVEPDAILLDIMMPKMNGYEVCAQLKGKLKTKNIPIIVLTGILEQVSRQEEEEWRDKLGIQEFISKPFDTEFVINRTLELIEPQKK